MVLRPPEIRRADRRPPRSAFSHSGSRSSPAPRRRGADLARGLGRRGCAGGDGSSGLATKAIDGGNQRGPSPPDESGGGRCTPPDGRRRVAGAEAAGSVREVMAIEVVRWEVAEHRVSAGRSPTTEGHRRSMESSTANSRVNQCTKR